MILPFLTQKVTHTWQVISICCKSSAYEQAKIVFNFIIFSSNMKKIKFPSMRFFNQFSIFYLNIHVNIHINIQTYKLGFDQKLSEYLCIQYLELNACAALCLSVYVFILF